MHDRIVYTTYSKIYRQIIGNYRTVNQVGWMENHNTEGNFYSTTKEQLEKCNEKNIPLKMITKFRIDVFRKPLKKTRINIEIYHLCV